MAATDSNVRVAVRVRPISRRGKEKNIWYLCTLIIRKMKLFLYDNFVFIRQWMSTFLELELGAKCVIDMCDNQTIIHHPAEESHGWVPWKRFFYVYYFFYSLLMSRDRRMSNFDLTRFFFFKYVYIFRFVIQLTCRQSFFDDGWL